MIRVMVRRQSTLALSQRLAAPQIKTAIVTKVDLHPDADSLYVSSMSAGEKEYTVVSGLRKFYSQEQLEGRKVALLTNLKPSKLRGVTSEAMVLAAASSTSEKTPQVELVDPPKSSPVGQSLRFEGASVDPAHVKSSMKPKFWRAIQQNLRTNDDCQVEYREDSVRFKLVAAGTNNEATETCTVSSITDGIVS